MANNLPPGVIPKLFRQRNKDGKEIGNWYIKIKKKAINLRSQSYSKARERAKDAWEMGVREFQDDRFFETPAPVSPIRSPDINAPVPGNEWAADVAAAAASGLQPDAYFDSAGKQTPLLTAVPGIDAPGDGKPPTAKVEDEKKSSDESTAIPPEMFDGMINNLATVLVEAQLQGQEWLIARAAKVKAGPVPMNNVGRAAGTKFWDQQLRKWLPSDVPLPEWAAAMCAVAMFSIPVQLQNTTPIVKEDAPSSPPSYPTTE